jgi:hypothetical protein
MGMKKKNALEKKSFLFGVGAGAGLVATTFTTFLLLNNFLNSSPNEEVEVQKALSEIVAPCFEGYNEGIVMLSKYTKEIEILTLFPNLERENVTKEQIICSLEAMNFSKSDAEDLFTEELGRLDNDDFQVKWEAKATCKNGAVYFCKKATANWQVRQLNILLKDFRP